MITGINHIAIAVSDLPQAIIRFTQDLGLTLDHQETVLSAQTETAFLNPLTTKLELIHPHNNQGPIAKFLAKRQGKGALHHICFESDDLPADITRLKAKGYKFIDDQPRPGAHGTQVVWIHPESCDGVLIELAQLAKTRACL